MKRSNLIEKKRDIQFATELYVANYHHSMMWALASAGILVASVLTLDLGERALWAVIILFMAVTGLKQYNLSHHFKEIKEELRKINKKLYKS